MIKNKEDLKDKIYVILEIIPTSIKNGDIVQLSAIKLEGLKLIDRFDYRLKENLIKIPDLLKITSYDKESFKYTLTTKSIKNKFKKFIEDAPLLIIDNIYTRNYLSDYNNEKVSVFDLLDIKTNENSFNILMDKYKLEPSNYLVDLIYEALIKEL